MIQILFRAAFGCALALGLFALPSAADAQVANSGVEQARQDSIRRPYTKYDIEFMSHMISHHAQAVAMAHWCNDAHGTSKSLQIYCGRVATAQTAEIELMQGWLKDRKQPVPDPDPHGMKMDMGGSSMYMMMPGMLTEEQMKQLDAARGKEFDRLFLTFMIQHHKGAIQMVDDLFAKAPPADEMVFKFSNDVQADQSTEIDRMEQMLAALTPEGWTGGRMDDSK
jgi:uncharacterized protein (DUF305 family)